MARFGIATLIIIWGLSVYGQPRWKAIGGDSPSSSVELVKEMLARADMSAEFTSWPRTRALHMVETRENHFLLSMVRTPEHEDKYKWVGPLVSADLRIVSRSDRPFAEVKSLEDLKKHKIGVLYGSAESFILEARGCQTEKVSQDQQNLQKLKAGRIDLYVAPADHIKQLEEQGMKFKTVLVLENLELYAAFHRKTPEHFIFKFNRILERMKKDGITERITAKNNRSDDSKEESKENSKTETK